MQCTAAELMFENKRQYVIEGAVKKNSEIEKHVKIIPIIL